MSRDHAGGAVDVDKAVRAIRLAGGFIAAVPGLVVLLSGYAYPTSITVMLGAVTTIVPTLAVMLLTARWAAVRAYVAARLVRLTVWTVAVFIASLGVLNLVHKHCVAVPQDAHTKDRGPLLYPLWLTGTFAQHVGEYGRQVAITDDGLGYDGVRQGIDDMPWGAVAWAVTITTLVVLHLSVSVSVTAAFALLAFHLAIVPPAGPPDTRPDPPPLAPLPAQPDPEKGGAD